MGDVTFRLRCRGAEFSKMFKEFSRIVAILSQARPSADIAFFFVLVQFMSQFRGRAADRENLE